MTKSVFLFLAVFAFLLTPVGRTADATTVSGKWHFVLDTPGGDRESDAIFEQTAEKVTGKWSVNDKGEGDAVMGTFADNKLKLEFPINSPEGGPGTIKITGTMADDGTLSGEWAFSDYNGSFKAKKVVK